ncbi:MAG: hypothetical protein EBT07_08705 [Actinobacteria bacterium]|nr:hypothetical protein [Actinomycetota bacterium]
MFEGRKWGRRFFFSFCFFLPVHLGFTQKLDLADTIWEGKLAVKIPELSRYINGVKESSAKGVELKNLPVEVWFPTETTFSVIYVANPPSGIEDGQRIGHKYFWSVGECVSPIAETQERFFGQGTVNLAKRTLIGTFGTRIRHPAPDATMNARYTYKKSKNNESLTITGMASILYQRLDPEHKRYLLDPRPSTVTYSGTFTKTTQRSVSVERVKIGEVGFGEGYKYGPEDNITKLPSKL